MSGENIDATKAKVEGMTEGDFIMYDYRKHLSKRECLINAILWTIATVGWLAVSMWKLRDSFGWTLAFMALQLAACTFHWRRYLRYDRGQKGGGEDRP